jgi:predicted nucleic acid-binding Zn ribbon protein
VTEAPDHKQKPPRRSALGRAIASMRGTQPKAGYRKPTASRGLRDPMLVGDSIDEVLGERGWQQVSALATLQATWAEVVGAELADHLTIETVDDGVLLLRADSTAWATQVELMLPTLTEQVRQAVGHEAVRAVKVRGPQAPSWSGGARRVKGRGPRDTYG